jgi:hypothetical protein
MDDQSLGMPLIFSRAHLRTSAMDSNKGTSKDEMIERLQQNGDRRSRYRRLLRHSVSTEAGKFERNPDTPAKSGGQTIGKDYVGAEMYNEPRSNSRHLFSHSYTMVTHYRSFCIDMK